MKYLLVLGVLMGGCVSAHKHVAPPSTAAVQSGINKGKQGAIDARLATKEAQRLNDINATDAQLIDAKATIIKRYWDKAQ